MTHLRAEALSLAYDEAEVVRGLDLAPPPARVTAVVHANAACARAGCAPLLQPACRARCRA